jgi:hypothetical protein
VSRRVAIDRNLAFHLHVGADRLARSHATDQRQSQQ